MLMFWFAVAMLVGMLFTSDTRGAAASALLGVGAFIFKFFAVIVLILVVMGLMKGCG